MSLGSSDMAASALGTAFSLLLLASIIQGLRAVEVLHDKKKEAIVGQNVTLPFIVKAGPDVHMVSIEWRKRNTKLAVYSRIYGLHLFQTNVSIQIEDKSLSSYLHLHGVTKWDSDVYICELTTFPLGSIRKETELQIKDVDVEITCDVDGTVEVLTGKNVTIRCRALPNAQYRWTKNKTLVSENESLELWRVTDAHTGVYTLTVNTGNRSLHKEFIITVQTATPNLSTDLVTVSPQLNVTAENSIKAADSGLTTSPTTGLSTIDTTVSLTMSMSTDGRDDNPNPTKVTITTGAQTTSSTNYTHINVTSSPATHTVPYHFNSSSDQDINPTHILNTSTSSDQSPASNLSTTLSYVSTGFRLTQEARNESMPYTVQPEVHSSVSPEEFSTLQNITENSDITGATPIGSTNVLTIECEDTDGARSHLLLVFIVVPVLVLIAVAGYLYRKQIIKERMDLPPPFKPPPPPVKYTAARHSEVLPQPFPISRCNSVAEQTFINVIS